MTQQLQSQIQSQPPPISPLSTKFKHHTPTTIAGLDPTHIVPQDDPRRTTPLDPSLPNIKLPSSNSNSTTKSSPDLTLNPLTLLPFTASDLQHHNFHSLRTQHATSTSAAQARLLAIADLKERLDEAERRTREIEREMEEKEKIRETERRVWAKRRGEVGSGTGLG